MTAEDAAGSRENGRVLAADALKQALGTVLDYASKGGYIVTWDAAAEAILAHPAMQEALREMAKDIGATAYAEGLHDAETNPERDRQAAIGAAVERLDKYHPDYYIELRHYAMSGAWQCRLLSPLGDLTPREMRGKGDTLPEAIDAALGDDDD